MSIKVGYLNEKYTYNDIIRANEALTLNSFDNSNIILLNTEANTTSDIFINYKNHLITGLTTSNEYIFKDMQKNERWVSLSTSNIIMNKPVIINDDLKAKDLLVTSNYTTFLNSNMIMTLMGQNDNFMIRNSNNELFTISSNTFVDIITNNMNIQDSSKNSLMNLNSSSMSLYNSLYINNGSLYVSEITGVNGGKVNLTNATYNSADIEKLTASKTLAVNNLLSDTTDNVSLEIFKNLGIKDIASINTCNLNTVTNVLTINRNGLVGIGTKTPDASLTIKKVSNNIINYSGDASGDVFNITKRGDIGIGTSNPAGQMHIKRNDDMFLNNEFRRSPMLNLDMMYDSSKNISNIYTTLNTTLKESTDVSDLPFNIKLYANTVTTSNLTDILNVNVNNTFYLINDTIYNGNTVQGNIANMSNIILPRSKRLDLPTAQQPFSTLANINITNSLIYPSSNTIQVLLDFNGVIDSANYEISYSCIMMTPTTFNSGGYNTVLGPGYNASNFTGYDITRPNTNTYTNKFNNTFYSLNNKNYRCKIDFIIEKNLLYDSTSRVVSYSFDYTTVKQEQLAAPNFMNLSYNNNFISSISPYGTLSLGTQVPNALKQEYLLYAPGKGLMNTLKVNVIDTNSGNNISFSQKNLTDVNDLYCQNLQAQNLNMANIVLTDMKTDSGSFKDLTASNLIFFKANNDYMSFSNLNINFNTRCSIGNTRDYGNPSCLKITVDNRIDANKYLGTYYENHNGILILNETSSVNPSLSIQTTAANATPYIHLNNSIGGYYFRVKTADNVTNFQIATNNIAIPSLRNTYFQGNTTVPHIIQHTKEYNTLSFGENDFICLDCDTKNYDVTLNTESSTKVSIGVPFKLYGASISPEEHVKYFNDTIKQPANPYALNVFGNTKIANISDQPMITAITQNDKIYTAVNGHPDAVHQMRVYGSLCSSNMLIYNNLSTSNLISSNILSYNISACNLVAYEKIVSKKIESSNLLGYDIITSNLRADNIVTSNIFTYDLECSKINMNQDAIIYTSNLHIYVPNRGPISLLDILINNNLLSYLDNV